MTIVAEANKEMGNVVWVCRNTMSNAYGDTYSSPEEALEALGWYCVNGKWSEPGDCDDGGYTQQEALSLCKVVIETSEKKAPGINYVFHYRFSLKITSWGAISTVKINEISIKPNGAIIRSPVDMRYTLDIDNTVGVAQGIVTLAWGKMYSICHSGKFDYVAITANGEMIEMSQERLSKLNDKTSEVTQDDVIGKRAHYEYPKHDGMVCVMYQVIPSKRGAGIRNGKKIRVNNGGDKTCYRYCLEVGNIYVMEVSDYRGTSFYYLQPITGTLVERITKSKTIKLVTSGGANM